MAKRYWFIVSLALIVLALFAADKKTNIQKIDTRMDWWREARFGMFIHWGLYAVPAGEWNGKTGYGEWIRNSAEIPLDQYDRFRTQFDPVKFNADDWVRTAKEAGMKYIVITSKHHDGFCMFDTKQTGFCIMNTPFHRDPMKELAEACRKYGLKFCFYYSIMDWHHPDYTPRRDWEKDRPVEGADFRRYIDYMKAELKELLTQYGEIGVLWFDGEWESCWNENFGKEIYTYCRSLQPNLIINNRVGAGRLDMAGLTREGAFGGDFGTPEQEIPAKGLPGTDWETCMTMNDHWGYNSHDKNFKSAAELIRMLADIASKGGNYLLNVGPTAEGVFPQESLDRLKEIGAWMKVNGESIWGTQANPFGELPWGRVTRKELKEGTRLYLHVFDWPASRKITLAGCLSEPASCRLLCDPGKKPLKVTRNEDALTVILPPAAPDPINTVIVLDLKGKIDLTNPPEIITAYPVFTDTIRVTLSSERENVQLHYTLDGSIPTIYSPVYTGPVSLNETRTVSARCFREGKPVSGAATRKIEKVLPLPEALTGDKAPGLKEGIRYRYYEGDWDSLPDFTRLRPVSDGTVGDFTLGPRRQEDHFGFVYEGFVKVPATAVYHFFTSSDDGSKLFLDDRLVVNNDLLHGALEAGGYIALEKGYHRIRVEFFEKTGDQSLKVSVKSPAMEKQDLPASWLFFN